MVPALAVIALISLAMVNVARPLEQVPIFAVAVLLIPRMQLANALHAHRRIAARLTKRLAIANAAIANVVHATKPENLPKVVAAAPVPLVHLRAADNLHREHKGNAKIFLHCPIRLRKWELQLLR